MQSEICYWVFCFVPVESQQAGKIFGFAEFLTALALLVVIYTIADVRYRFRLAVTPGALHASTFVVIALIGMQTLLTDVWIAQGWWVPKTAYLTRSTWQGIFGLLFLGTFLTWMYYAFIRPPVYGRRNARRFAQELYRYILRGNDDELRVIANELARSAEPIVRHSKRLSSRSREGREAPKEGKRKAGVEDFAHDILLLIANRKFCRQVVAATPVTAQAFFQEMANANKFNIPIGQFARNVSSEAIAQKGSFIYEEAEGYESGLLGYLKPVSQAIYGNYMLAEALGSNASSPLDISYEEQWAWDTKQWEAYCRAILLTFADFLGGRSSSGHSFALYRAFGDVKSAYRDLYKLNEVPDAFDADAQGRLRVAVRFVKDAIKLIDEQANPPVPLRRVRERTFSKNVYDYLAELIFDMCLAASSVRSPPELSWWINHNTVWSEFFGLVGSGRAWSIVHLKVRRLLYDEIARLTTVPNYKSARILGFCLYVLGLGLGTSKKDYRRPQYPLARAIHSWARKNYLRLRHANREVAEWVLLGSLSFDEVGNHLVKTFAKGLSPEPPKEYLDLEPLPAGEGGAATAG